MTAEPVRSSARRHWSLDDIPWHAINHDAVAHNETFFYLVTSASLTRISHTGGGHEWFALVVRIRW